MADPFWVSLADAVQNWATAAAILFGGVWAFYRFVIRRERETAIAIDMNTTCTPYGQGHFLAFFDVTLTNKASVRVTAKRARSPAYEDTAETLNFSGSLLVRRVSPGTAPGPFVRWFSESAPSSPQPGDIQADLLDEYELNGKTDFWMEPGESYHVNAGIVLADGTYLAMVTFVAAKSDKEFWRRVFLVEVPAPALPARPIGTPAV